MSIINTPQGCTVLRKETTDAANRLVRLNIDSCKGWTVAAENTEDLALRARFFQFARIRDESGSELQQLVRSASQVPPETGTVEGSVHRWWLNIRAKISGADLHAILVEAERGEDAIKNAYESILQEPTSPELMAVFARQYTQVKAIHDEVKAMRDSPEFKK